MINKVEFLVTRLFAKLERRRNRLRTCVPFAGFLFAVMPVTTLSRRTSAKAGFASKPLATTVSLCTAHLFRSFIHVRTFVHWTLDHCLDIACLVIGHSYRGRSAAQIRVSQSAISHVTP